MCVKFENKTYPAPTNSSAPGDNCMTTEECYSTATCVNFTCKIESTARKCAWGSMTAKENPTPNKLCSPK